MLLKPQEEVMFRPRRDGGLGILHVPSKAMAGMARTFMETAANPKFKRRLDHQALYLHEVKGENWLKHPGDSQYYQEDFLRMLTSIWKEKGDLIESMTEKEWYRCIYEKNCMLETEEGGVIHPLC